MISEFKNFRNFEIVSKTCDSIKNPFLDIDYFRRLIENKIIKKSFIKNENGLNTNKFLFYSPLNGFDVEDKNYSKFLELKTFHYLLNSKIFSNSSSDPIEDISNLFLTKDRKVYNRIQDDLRSLNHENIFKIKSELNRINTDLRIKTITEENSFNFSQKFYFEEDLSSDAIIQIIKNKNNPIIIKDFTLAYEKPNLKAKNNDMELDELNLPYRTIFNFKIKKDKNIKRQKLFDAEYIILNSKDDCGTQKVCVLPPASLLIVEDISVEFLLASRRPYFKVDCSLSNEIENDWCLDAIAFNSKHKGWDSYIDKISSNSVVYSNEFLYLIDYLLYTDEYKENSVKFAKDLISMLDRLNLNEILKSSDYLLLGKLYNYAGNYHRSNLFYKRSQTVVINESASDLSVHKNIIQYCININMSLISIEEKNGVRGGYYFKEAQKYYQELLIKQKSIPQIDFKHLKTLYISQSLRIDPNEFYKIIFNDSKEFDFKNEIYSPMLYNSLVNILCNSNKSDTAAAYYKNLINLQVINFYLNVFIGAIYLNIIQGLKSKYSYYKLKSIEGYISDLDFTAIARGKGDIQTENASDNLSPIKRSNVIAKEVSISLIRTNEFMQKVTFIIADTLMYYPCYYHDNKKFLDNTIIIKIFPFSLVEFHEDSRTYFIKENIVLEKLYELSSQSFENRYHLYFENYPFRLQRLENVERCENLIEILNELFFLVNSFNELNKFEDNFFQKKFILDLMVKILERIYFLMILPQFDLWDILRKSKYKEENSPLRTFFDIFKFCVKGSVDLLKKFKNLLCHFNRVKVFEFLERKINSVDKEENYQNEKEFCHKIKSDSVKKLLDGKFNLSEFIYNVENKFFKKDVVSEFLLKSFVMKFLKEAINKNILKGEIERSENILNKNLLYLKYDGKNSLNSFILRSVIKISKIKKKITELQGNYSLSISHFKIKSQINNLKEELRKLQNIFQENFSYFINRKNSMSTFPNLRELKFITTQTLQL